ncbi:MAG: TlpA family protein disulfide reductase [Bacteroidaceae bacterium]|nr:TlpA family protein disulfide reductase [Bacteroidaceae bacterium]
MKKVILKPLMVALLACVSVAGWAKDVVWDQPSTEVNREIEGFFSPLLEITRVEFAKDETRVFMHIADRPENWVRISSASYLRADGKQYALKSLDGMQLDQETYLTDHGRVDVVLHFEPLPQKTKRFDFTEGDFQGAWQLLGVEQPSTRASQLFPSNWRNTQTGDWDISFFDECAIYDCKFWNYKQKEQKGDKYTFVLENGGKEIVVNVDKNKAGKRIMTIDGRKGEYNFISSITLPDYPQKDTSTSFKDTGYKTDTVTFIGWLKDMPLNMLMRGDEFDASVCDDFFTGDQSETYAKMDSLGRFEMKIPVLNSAEVFTDWNRTFIRTMFEPGETYLLLYDFKGGHKMFMGKNCRLQNEILAHPIEWVGNHPEERGLDREAALKFFEDTKADKADAMNILQQVVEEHPNISERYIKYLTGSYNACECAALMQGRFSMKNWSVPSEILDYVNQVGWQQAAKPYTLYREFRTFKRDYIDQLVMDRYSVPVDGGYISFSTTVYPYILKKYKDAGKLQISDEELEIVKRYAEGCKKFCTIIDKDEEMQKASDEFYSSELAKQFGAIHDREDVQKIIDDEMPLFEVYKTVSILDSIGCDQDMRDILITSELFEILDHERQPLSDNLMNYLEENVKMPAAKAFLKDKQEKYLAISRRDISKSPSLKSPEDVANMSDGEKILRKLIEPYKGKIILMDIWGTWCGPCKEALSHSQEEYERLKDFDLVYLYLANRSPEETWQNVIKQYEVLGDNVVHYNLPEAQQSAIEKFVKITGYPTFKLIDREGNLLDVNADPRDLEGLARLLKQMQ